MMHPKLNKSLIVNHLDQSTLNCFDEFILLNEVTSTNDVIDTKLLESPEKNVICIAESQTQGRGRLGRTWVSPAHCHIYLSFSWYFNCTQNKLQGLSVDIGNAIIQALKKCQVTQHIQLKWPNDIFFDHKKLGGVLIETRPIRQKNCVAIVGIGLNVHEYVDEAKAIDQPWITLDQVTQSHNDRNVLIGAILNSICALLLNTF